MARVLYIDDCHRDRTLASIALRGRGHDFADAADGEDALIYARSFGPDCIVVNPKVAVIGGDDLLEKLVDLAPSAKLVVIGCGLRQRFIDHATDFGASTCLSRPYSIDELVSAVEDSPVIKKLGAA